MLIRSIAIWLLLTASAFAQTIGGLSTVPPLTEARFPVSGLAVPQGSIDELSKWASGLVVAVNGPADCEASIEVDIGLVKRQPVIYFSGDKPGLYVLALVDAKAKDPVIATKRVQVGEVVPPTPNPIPPSPTPIPPQPTPPPPVDPAPLKQPGLRVLILYESSTTLASGMTMIVSGATVRNMLKEKCVKEDGQPCFRIFDADTDVKSSPQWVKDGMARKRDALPWIIISNGMTGFEGPCPETPKSVMDLMEKYAK